MALFKGTVTITVGVKLNAINIETAETILREHVYAAAFGYDAHTDTNAVDLTGRYDKAVDIKMIEV